MIFFFKALVACDCVRNGVAGMTNQRWEKNKSWWSFHLPWNTSMPRPRRWLVINHRVCEDAGEEGQLVLVSRRITEQSVNMEYTRTSPRLD